MTDHYIEAVRAWQNGNRNLKHFAECAAQVDNRRTASLAADCCVSVDTIENYRNAYRLYYDLLVGTENPIISEIWAKANISIWIAAAKRRKAHDETTLHEYLETAVSNNMTVEQFRVELDSRALTKPEWTKRLQKLVKTLFKLRTDWKTEIPAEKRAEFENWLEGFEHWLKELAEAE